MYTLWAANVDWNRSSTGAGHSGRPYSRLGEESVSRGSVRIDIPDLTAGKWRNATPHPVHRDLG